jgi:polygalacturonase
MRSFKARKHAEQSRLSRSGSAHKCHELPWLNGERNIVEYKRQVRAATSFMRVARRSPQDGEKSGTQGGMEASVSLNRRTFLTHTTALAAGHRLLAADGAPPTQAEILRRIKAPVFPNRDFDITKYGAEQGGTMDCTDAIRQAIAACAKAGGGRVVVPGGIFLTRALHLESNVNLHISEGATLRFSNNTGHYLPVVYTRWEGTECMNYSPLIYAFEKNNIAVTGAGTLDGGADASGEKKVPVKDRIYGAGHFLRPNFVQPYRCTNVLIDGMRIINSPLVGIEPGTLHQRHHPQHTHRYTRTE